MRMKPYLHLFIDSHRHSQPMRAEGKAIVPRLEEPGALDMKKCSAIIHSLLYDGFV